MMFHVFFVFLQKILYLKTMGIVKIKDKSFKTSIPEAEILKKVCSSWFSTVIDECVGGSFKLISIGRIRC